MRLTDVPTHYDRAARCVLSLALGSWLALGSSWARADDSAAEPDSVEADVAGEPSPSPRMIFSRADDLASLPAQSFSANYAIESGKNFGENVDPVGILHRLQASYGVTDWLKLSVELNGKHRLDTEEFKVGVLAPQLRLTLGGILPDVSRAWPLDVSAYFGPRIRIQGRRDPALVFGFGTNTPDGPLHFTVNTGVEITVPRPGGDTEQSFGPRYDLGVGYEVGYGFIVSAEAWGHAAWSRGGYEEQEHHAGPSLHYGYDIARFGLGVAGGWRGQPQGERSDVRGMFTVGLEI